MKLLCKAVPPSRLGNFTPGKFYEVFSKDIDSYLIINDENYGVWFTLDSRRFWHLYDYFYTPQEERQMKLKQIETAL